MSSDTDYSSSETDLPTSSDESDVEEQEKSKAVSGTSNLPPITEKERLSLIIFAHGWVTSMSLVVTPMALDHSLDSD